MNTQEIHKKLESKFGKEIISLEEIHGDAYIEVARLKLLEICKFLHQDDALLFDSLVCISGVHYPVGKQRNTQAIDEKQEEKKDLFEVVYHFFSFSHKHSLTLKIILVAGDLKVPTLTPLWKGADFLERETFDMFGIEFVNHPDLRRILCPDDWEGWPLRKDYVVQEMYKHMRVPL